MRNLILLGMTSLFLISCKVDVKGPLHVKEELNLNIEFKKRRKEYKGTIGLVKGKTYDSEIKFNSKRKVTLIVKDIKFEGKDVDMKATFKVPKGTKLPKRSGSFHINAADSKQEVDVVGSVETEFTSSEIEFDRESCRYTDYERKKERQCRKVCPSERPRRDGDRRGRGGRNNPNREDQFEISELDENGCFEKCKMVQKIVEVDKWGMQDVEFHHNFEDRDYEINFTEANGSLVLAEFAGTWHDSKKVYDHKGFCEGPRSRIWHRRHGNNRSHLLD